MEILLNKSAGSAGISSAGSSSMSSSWLATIRSSINLTTYVFPLLVLYPILCTTLRHRRIKNTLQEYEFTKTAPSTQSNTTTTTTTTTDKPASSTPRPYSAMTTTEAFAIQQRVAELEFPAMYEKGLQFALFRTYGIPSISELLVATRQLSTSTHVGKRYADTAVLVSEMYGNAPDHPRTIEAFSRLNYLHGHYLRQGKISNDDMLYTLALFMNQPVEFIERYEWRGITELERCAIGVFHKAMADGMEIKLDVLPGYHVEGRWRDGLHFYDELDAWAKRYEEKVMVSSQVNFDTAVRTRELLLSTFPKSVHGFMGNLISAMMDRRLREAIIFDKPPPRYRQVMDALLEVRRYYLRYLALPRIKPDRYVTDETDEKGRRHLSRYDTLPTYIKPTLWNRYGPSSWMSWCLGIPLPGDEGMYPEGFFVKDLGPKAFLGKGDQEVGKYKQKLAEQERGGCPFLIR